MLSRSNQGKPSGNFAALFPIGSSPIPTSLSTESTNVWKFESTPGPREKRLCTSGSGGIKTVTNAEPCPTTPFALRATTVKV